MSPAKKWFAFMTVFAFASVICFFNVNSYFADKHRINALFIVFGILFAILAVYGLKKVNDVAGTKGSDRGI
jgi:FtsH-binding integral membrane protein